ncbi:MAG: single-stranded DNA-binding protein [Nitrospinota bacterium]
MASMNKVFLIGNLTRDPELRYTPSGAAVAGFGLAVNRKYKQGDELKEDTCFVDITVWNRQAETCTEYLSKGSAVLVEGRLSFRSWETDDGQKRSKLDVVAINVQFLSRSGGAEAGAAGAGSAERGANSGKGNNPPPSQENARTHDGPEDDIPF